MRIAIYGCGQLAGMLAMEGLKLGHEFVFIADPDEDTACVDGMGKIVKRSAATLDASIVSALRSVEVITVEREQIELALLEQCAALSTLLPPLNAIAATRDRWLEKTMLDGIGIPVAPFFDLVDIAEQPDGDGRGFIVKSCRSGYDGKHQYRVSSLSEIADLDLGERRRGDWIVESIIPFDFEFSVIGARAKDGTVVLYPPTENLHVGGILRRSATPTPRVRAELLATSQQYLRQTLEKMGHVGILAMECFAVDGHCLVNELAPRVHNSGHWSLFDTAASQFSNHIRAITGMPLVEPRFSGVRGMVNIIGEDRDEASFAPDPDIQVMRYPKSARPGRKLGHVNVRKQQFAELIAALDVIEVDIYGDQSSTRR